MKNLLLEKNLVSFRKKISILTIISMLFSCLTPATSIFAESHFTNDVYQFVDEIEVEDDLVNEGMFYIPHSHLEVKENTENKKFVFKVLRKGEIEKNEKVKLTMMDITGKYGKDYKIKVIDKALFAENVQGVLKAKSILEYAQENDVNEYNYSDAIVDGSIGSEDIMTDDEKKNYKMSDEEKESMINTANTILSDAGFDTEVEEVKVSTSVEDETEDTSEEKDANEEEDTNEEEILDNTVSNSANEENATVEETTEIEEKNETVKSFTNTDTSISEEKNNDDENKFEETTIEETTIEETTTEETTTEEITTEEATTEEATTEETTTEETTTEETTTEETTTEETTTEETTTEETTIEKTTDDKSKANTTKEKASEEENKDDTNEKKVAVDEKGTEVRTEKIVDEENDVNATISELTKEEQSNSENEDTKSEAVNATSEVGNATMSEIIYGDEVVEFDTKIATISSSEAYELVTGLKDDRKKVVPDRNGKPLDIINPNSLENKAFMNDGVEAIEEELKSAYVMLDFKSKQVEKLIEITILDDNKYRGKKQVGFHLSSDDNKNISGAYSSLTLIIEDDEPVEKSFINFTKTVYEPKDGYVYVEMERTGDLGSVASVMLDSEDITAKRGQDYSEVHTKVAFGMGLSKRHIKIPVVSTHIKGSASFKLKLQEAEGAEVGEKWSAICTIKETDNSFKFANTKSTEKTDNGLFGNSSESKDSGSSLFGEDTRKKKITREKIELTDSYKLDSSEPDFYSDKTLNKDSFSKLINDGYGFHIYMRSLGVIPIGFNKDDYSGPYFPIYWISGHNSFAKIRFDGIHANSRAYKGFQLDWSKDTTGGELILAEGDLLFDFNFDVSDATEKRYKGAKWNKKENIFFKYNHSQAGFVVQVNRKFGIGYDNINVKVNSLKFIKTMYDVDLLPSIAPGFIDENGKADKSNTHNQSETKFEDGLTIRKDVGYVGKTITVTLANATGNCPYYIKKLYISKDNNYKDLKMISSNNDTNATSISFEMTHDFIKENGDYLHEIDGIGDGAGSKDGQFYIVAELAKKPARVRIAKNADVDVDIWGKKPNKVTATELIYDFGIEDAMRINAKMKGAKKNDHRVVGFNRYFVEPFKINNEPINKAFGQDYYLSEFNATEILLEPALSENNNQIVVRVPKNQDALFDKTYGFMEEITPNINGNYYEYVVVPKGENVFAEHFAFKAKAKDSTNIAVWAEAKNMNLKYAQDTFYYLGDADPKKNIIYLSTVKADDNKYLLTGTAHYEEQPLGSKTTGTHWQAAANIGILVDDNSFGYTNEKGVYTIVPSKGKDGYYRRLNIVNGGVSIYKNVKLNKKQLTNTSYEIVYKEGNKKKTKVVTEKVYKVVPEVIVITNYNNEHPKVTGVTAYSVANGNLYPQSNIKINGERTVIKVRTAPKRPNGRPYIYTYTEKTNKGEVKRSVVEDIKSVELLVIDPKSHNIKKTIVSTMSNADKTEWTVNYAFAQGNYKEYKADDMLYVRLVTDRKVGDGKGDDITQKGSRKEIPIFNETTYQAISTGLPFVAVSDTIPVEAKIDLKKFSPTSEELKLPIIGVLDFFAGIAGLTFTQTFENNISTVKIGKDFKTKTNKYDEKGKLRDESTVGVAIDKDNFLDGFKLLKERMEQEGKATYTKDNEGKWKVDKVTLGLPIWSFKPMVGIEFKYQLTDDIGEGKVGTEYQFISGNGFFGIIFNYKYTFYFTVAGIPLYVGGEVNLTLISEMGIAVDEGKKVVIDGPMIFDTKYIESLIINTHFEFIIRATMDTTAYAGIGICGTLGVRGGFTLNMRFIWHPHIKKKYSKVRPVGLGVSGAIKIWIDAVFISIPIEPLSWGENDWYKLGYFEDIEKVKKSNSSKSSKNNLYGSVIDKTEFRSTPRFKGKSEFVANENKYGDGLFGGTYVVDETKTLLSDTYDSSDPKIISYDSDGDDVKDKALLIYLDDDHSRSNLDRSVLKYMIYDVATNHWSAPQVLQDDGTADFSPNMVDMGAEKIIVSWSSRKTPVDEDTDKANLLKDMEIYSVFFNKENNTFGDIAQLTNDDYYDYYPKASYDVVGGKLELYYLKNEKVGEIDTTDDLLNEVQTEVNESQLMYRVYDLDWDEGIFKWQTSYEDYELPSTLTPVEKTAFINKYRGQRMKDLSINLGDTINNNPNISDYVVVHAPLLDPNDEVVENIMNTIKTEIEAHYDPENPEYIPDEVKDFIDSLIPQLALRIKNYSVVSYVVDEDGNPETNKDTDIYIKIASGSEIKTIRVTKNNVSDTMPKLIEAGGIACLFWIQNDSMIKMLSLGDLIERSIYEDHANKGLEVGDVNIVTTDNIIMGNKLANIEPFSDDKGNIYVAWQQDSAGIPGENEDIEEIDFKQNLYVAGLIMSENPDDPTKFVNSWSNPVQFTDNGKVNNLPAATDINGKLLLINNQYNMKSNGDTYNITNSELVSMTYKPKSSLEVTSVDADKISEVDGNKTYKLAINIHNAGLYKGKGFDYVGAVKYDGRTILDIDGTSNRNVVPASYVVVSSMSDAVDAKVLTFTLSEEQQKRLDRVTIDLNVKEHGIGDEGIDYSGLVFDVDENYEFLNSYPAGDDNEYFKDYLRVEQVGEDFEVKGILQNTGNIDSKGDAKIYVIDQSDWDNPIAESNYIELPRTAQLSFNIPISGDKIKNMQKGIKDLVVYVANDEGENLSIPEVATLHIDTPYKFKVNGNSNEIKLNVGQTLKLDTSYEPVDRYQGATIMYAVDDESIAESGDNTIKGLRAGETTMKLTTKEFGGSTEVKVIVVPNNNNNDDRRSSGGGSGSGGGGGAGPMSSAGPKTTTVPVSMLNANIVNATNTAWIYEPINNTWKLSVILADGVNSEARNGFYIVQKERTTIINGIPSVNIINETYYFDNEGTMVTGWIETSDKNWYFFDNLKTMDEGKMVVGWKQISGSWYYFGENGMMYKNTLTPDGYFVDTNGRWVQ